MKKQILMAAITLCALAGSKQVNAQWSLTGNAATNPATNFIGTTDLQNLNIRTNNTNRVTVASDGKVGIGTAAPAQVLDVQSAGTTNVNVKSTVSNANILLDRFNSASNASVSYRTNGSPTWQTGTLGNDNFSIRNITAASNAFTILAANSNVGIGTTTPTSRLSVLGNVDINGNVGIGNSTPSQKLDVTGSVQASGYVIADAYQTNTGLITDFNVKLGGVNSGEAIGSKRTAGGNQYGMDFFTSSLNRMVITNTGYVGVGTTTPFSNFVVNSGSNGSQQRGIWSGQYSNSGIGALIGGRKARGTEATPLAVNNGDYGAALVAQNFDGTNYLNNGSIGYRVTGNPAAGNIPGEWYFGSNSGNDVDPYGNNTVRMVVQSTGNVGIGNTTPSQKLDVTGNVQSSGNVIADAYQTNNGTAASNGLQLGGPASGEVIGSKRSAGGNQFGLDFYTASLKRLAINSNGYVGIGVDVPSAHLEVSSVSSTGTSEVIKNTGTGNVGLELRSTATPSTQFIDFQDGATSNTTPDYRNRIASTPTSLAISTNAVANALTILNNGNVGISNSAPSNKLSVTGDANVDGAVFVRNAANTLAYGKIQHTGNSGNFHLDTYGTGGIYLNYFSGTGTYICNGTNGVVASFLQNGNVGIGTNPTTYKLEVCGTIRAKEVRVETGWCDYVFANDYKLRPLSEVESFIKENKHLPEVTPGDEIESNGLEVGKASAQMIKKIEELTLYAIEQQKRIDDLQKQMEELKKDKR